MKNRNYDDMTYNEKLLQAMILLKDAWKNLGALFYDTQHEANDYIVENYPFDKSFDEINVEDWCDTVICELEDELAVNKAVDDRYNAEQQYDAWLEGQDELDICDY